MQSTIKDNLLLNAALSYAARGLRVIPVHDVSGGSCSCGKADCKNVAKHPRTARGLKDGTTDPATIRQWWMTWPTANVAIVTGPESGVVMIGPDGEQGKEDLAALVVEHGPLPPCPREISGSGGQHLYFRHPGPKIKNRQNHAGTKIDVRGDGGYAIVTPSRNGSGAYQWIDPPGVNELPLMPEWLIRWCVTDERTPEPARVATPHAAATGGGYLVEYDRKVLADRGIPLTVATAAGLRTETDPKVISARLGWRWRRPDGPVMLIPFFDPEGEAMQFGQVRPQRPKDNKTTGKPAKYLSPKNSTTQPYFPPNVRADVLADGSIPLVITEGPLKGLALAAAGYHAIALVGVWNFGRRRETDDAGNKIGPMELNDELACIAWAGRTVIVCYDSDAAKNESVRAAEITLVKLLTAAGAVVKIARLPEGDDGTKNGVDDYLVRHGKLALDTIFAAAQSPAATAKPLIYVGTDEYRVVDEVIAALCADDDLFVRNDLIVRIRENVETGAVTTPAVEPPDMRRRITEQCYLAIASDEGPKPCHPADWLVQQTLAHPDPPGMRRLAGISGVPILRPDGSIHTRPGYDPITRCYYHPRGLDVPPLDRLTRDDAARAAGNLLGIIDDMPIADGAGRSVWLSLVLSPIGRHLIAGSVPGHLVTANVRGSGKGLSATCAALIATGADMPCQAYSSDAAEMRKLLTSVVLGGSPYLCFDNLESGGTIGGAGLDMVLTSGRHQDRLLGGNRLLDAPFRAVVAATGNNVMTRDDAARRWLVCMMDSPTATPEDRTDFRHPNLATHVRAHRGRYVADAITILAAYIQAGRPDMRLGPTGSFQDWSDLVRSAIVWAGGADSWTTVTARRASADAEANEHLALIRAWDALDLGCTGLTVAAAKRQYDLAQPTVGNSREATRYGAVEDLIAESGWKGFDARKAGYLLRKHKDRPTPDGRRIVSRTGQGGTHTWRVTSSSARQ